MENGQTINFLIQIKFGQTFGPLGFETPQQSTTQLHDMTHDINFINALRLNLLVKQNQQYNPCNAF